MTDHDIARTMQSFEDLEMDARVDHLLSRSPEEGRVLSAYLLLSMRDEIQEIKRERRWVYTVGHAFAIVIAAAAGILGQPLRPGP